MRKLIVIGLAGLLAACAQGSGGSGGSDGMAIPTGVWAKFEEYKGNLQPGSDEYFAASSDGGYASSTDKDQVIKDCQQYAQQQCVLFAHNDETLVPYHVE